MTQVTTAPAALRLERLRERLERRGAAAFVSVSPANQTYLAGFRALLYSRPIVLVATLQTTTLIVPALELRHASEAAGVDRVIAYYEHAEAPGGASHLPLLDELLAPLGSAPIAVEAAVCPLALAERLRGGGRELLAFDAELERMRAVKDDSELAAIRRSAEVVGEGVAAAVAALPQAAILEELMMTPSGPERSTLPHVFSTTRRLQAGDGLIHTRQVGIDGYRAELERTVLLDPPSAEQRRVLAATERAQQAGLAAVAAGRSCASVDRAARAVFDEAGLGAHVVHRSGHGIGLLPHEPPYLRFDAEEPLEAGMVITIEPGVYVPGLGGFRHSDTVVVTDDGCELLTELPE